MATKKSQGVGAGYHRPVCVKCQLELSPETNGVGLLDMNDNGAYQLWDTDKWKCPRCGIEVIGGFASGPISAHWQPRLPLTNSILTRNAGSSGVRLMRLDRLGSRK